MTMNNMKSILSLLLKLSFGVTLHAQQVGIRVANPQEALDVNGNIQLNGALKINGNAGLPGQQLKRTAQGMAWENMTLQQSMTRWQVFTTPINGTPWTVPAGVTEVMVEIWGAGGGGSSSVDGSGGGGGSGAYSCGVIDVTNVSSLAIYVGSGGAGGRVANGQDGQASEVRWTQFAVNYRIQSAGGLRGLVDAAGGGGPIAPGVTVVPSTMSLFQLPGQSGSPVRSTHTLAASGIFYRLVYGSEGGAAFQFAEYAKPGSNYGFDPNNTNTAASIFGSDSDNIALAGFGGSSNKRTTNDGADGGHGMVVIRW
jgi:trimeric autotransporter adhesin